MYELLLMFLHLRTIAGENCMRWPHDSCKPTFVSIKSNGTQTFRTIHHLRNWTETRWQYFVQVAKTSLSNPLFHITHHYWALSIRVLRPQSLKSQPSAQLSYTLPLYIANVDDNCPVCQSSSTHPSYTCSRFKSLSYEQMISAVKHHRYCMKCLKLGQCTSTQKIKAMHLNSKMPYMSKTSSHSTTWGVEDRRPWLHQVSLNHLWLDLSVLIIQWPQMLLNPLLYPGRCY